jgi:hypothetical protein
VIAMLEKDKYYGKEEEYSTELMARVMSIAIAIGKYEVKQHYYFLKLFPFSLGGATIDWYNSLAPRSVTSKDE